MNSGVPAGVYRRHRLMQEGSYNCWTGKRGKRNEVLLGKSQAIAIREQKLSCRDVPLIQV